MLRQVGIQFTNACNGRCIMCDNRLSKRKYEYMSLKQLEKVVSEVSSLGATGPNLPTGICGLGEALLHPDLDSMLDVVKVLPWCFGSNCDLLTPEWSSKILDRHPTLVSLSIDSMNPEVSKQIRPGIDFEKSVRHAIAFIEETKLREVWNRQFFIQIVVMKQNIGHVQPWVDFWLPKIKDVPGFKLHIKPVFLWPRIENGDSFYPAPKPDIQPHPQIQIDDFTPHPIRPTCRLFWNFAMVLSNGAYMPCCMCSDDVWQIGNVFETSLLECYRSEKLEQYRNLLEQKRYDELPLCEKCR